DGLKIATVASRTLRARLRAWEAIGRRMCRICSYERLSKDRLMDAKRTGSRKAYLSESRILDCWRREAFELGPRRIGIGDMGNEIVSPVSRLVCLLQTQFFC